MLESDIRTMLENAWDRRGYSVPNPETYPWQWCWDSCFHAIIWAMVDTSRAERELESVFAAQNDDGFVPHMTYHADPDAAIELWNQPRHSSITNPPMYGHALRVLQDAGVSLPASLVTSAARGLRWLVAHRTRQDGLVVACHPWETGCDDTPRWDAFVTTPFDKREWDRRKREVLLPAVVVDGGIVANPSFEVAAASFNALVAFNLREFALVDPDGRWTDAATRIEAGLVERWNGATWVDGAHSLADAPTLEALLGVLLEDRPEVWEALADETRFRGALGLWQVSRRHPGVDPDGYWRGASWAPLEYLFWVAARRHGHTSVAAEMGRRFVRGAAASNLAEYWHPETGAPHGARPQTWTGLALVVDRWLQGGDRP